MKYSYDSYRLYQTGTRIRDVVRVKVTMKEKVDLSVLRIAINEATNRYPYFKKRIIVNEEGAYDLIDNPLPIVVMETREKAPMLCSEEVNEHMIYADAEGCNIYLCISHTLAGGKGIQPWVMTCIYQYVTMKYGIEIDAPAIRKVDSPFLPTELLEPDFHLLPQDEPEYDHVFPKAYKLLKDYINGFFNPFAKKEEYYLFTFQQSDFLKYCNETDSSVASLVTILYFKAFDKVVPKKAKRIRGTLAHNPCARMGLPDTHCDILTHVHVDYDREMANYSMDKLGTITRGQIILQTGTTSSMNEFRRKLALNEGIDRCHGLKAKRKFAKKYHMGIGKGSVHGSYHINYTGYADWGELKNYVESMIYIVDGHFVSEVSAVGDKIFLASMALVKAEKYIKAMEEVLKELEIPYKLEGPFPKNLPCQDFPKK